MKGQNSVFDYAVVFILLLFCLSGILISIFTLFGLPIIFGDESEVQSIDFLNGSRDFSISLIDPAAADGSPDDSPVYVPLLVKTPPIPAGAELSIIASDGNRIIARTDCLEAFAGDESYEGMTVFECNAGVPYNYATRNTIELRALLEPLEGESLATNRIQLSYDWDYYEINFWEFGLLLLVFVFAGFLFLVLPVAAAMYHAASKEKHHAIYKGEYTLSSLIDPFRHVKKPSEFLQAFIASPLFWMLEIIGVVIFVAALAMGADALKSEEAMLAFVISGGIAFFTPFLWVTAWWFADYKEREPLRIIVSLFLWGAFAALMAIGINSVVDEIFISLGIGALASALMIPVFEELFKGSGLVLFSLHHEYDTVADGLVFGFTVGMGFAFVENWLYLLQNPMGADIGMWLFIFFLRSIMLSAMHGVYTSMTGGIIGYMKSRSHPYVFLSIAAMAPAMFFHAVHNSSDLIAAFFGLGGLTLYCCIIMPLFDYGGLVLVALAMLGWLAFFSKKKTQKFRHRAVQNPKIP